MDTDSPLYYTDSGEIWDGKSDELTRNQDDVYPTDSILTDWILAHKPTELLALGTGHGRFERNNLLNKDIKLYGQDISGEQLKKYKKNVPTGTVHCQCAIKDIPEGRKFPVAFCSGTLTHIPPADILASLTRIGTLCEVFIASEFFIIEADSESLFVQGDRLTYQAGGSFCGKGMDTFCYDYRKLFSVFKGEFKSTRLSKDSRYGVLEFKFRN